MTDTATSVAAAPFVAALQPYLVAAATALVGGAVTLAAAAFHRLTGREIAASNLAAVRAAAEDEAGKMVAGAADNMAQARITVTSDVVRGAAESVAARLPAEIAAAGVTPADLGHMITGEVGKLQARMTAPPKPLTPGP